MKAEDLTHGTLMEWGDPVPASLPVCGVALRGADGELAAVLAVFDMSQANLDALPDDDIRTQRFRAAPGWWCAMDSRGTVSPLAHRYALKVKSGLRLAGVKKVFADPDPAIPRSDMWLARLGFVPWRLGIWRCDLGLGVEGHRAGHGGRCGQGGGRAAQGGGLC